MCYLKSKIHFLRVQNEKTAIHFKMNAEKLDYALLHRAGKGLCGFLLKGHENYLHNNMYFLLVTEGDGVEYV